MKARIPVLGTIGKTLQIETGATIGATIGEDLRLPDGRVPSLTELQALFAGEEGDPNAFASTIWSLIEEVPPNITEVEELATTGLVTRLSDGSWVTRAIDVQADGLLEIANPTGDAGNPSLGAADQPGLSVWGRDVDTVGKPLAILALSDGDVLRRNGALLDFGQIEQTSVIGLPEDLLDLSTGIDAVAEAPLLLTAPAPGELPNARELVQGSGISFDDTTPGQRVISVPMLVDGDRGDITVGDSGTTLTIDDKAVTYPKIQDVTASRLLGRGDSGAGSVEEITLGTGLSFSGTTLNATGGGGGGTGYPPQLGYAGI